jgi:hypothetical protein
MYLPRTHTCHLSLLLPASAAQAMQPTYQPRRFYPGLALPTLPMLGAGTTARAAGSIDAPDADGALASAPTPALADDDELQMPGTARARAPRVVGSFDHAVLPEPPVRARARDFGQR